MIPPTIFRGLSRTLLWLLASICALSSVPAAAQQDTGGATKTVVVAAGEQYRAGLLHRLVLGRHYRDLWTMGVEVELLDLDSFAGGLEPLRTG